MAMFNTSLSNALFGSSSSIGSGSFLSASNFGDLALIKNGTYKKMMKSYISQLTEDDSSSKKSSSAYTNLVSEKMDKLKNKPTNTATDAANKVLSTIKSDAKKLETSANALSGMDFDESTKEELYAAAKTFVSDYNSLLKSAGDTDNTGLTKSVKWMTDDLKVREKALAKIGVTVKSDGTLSLDEEKFNAANLTDIKSQMKGSSSIIGKTAQRATGIAKLAANQISYSSGNSLYSSNGVLK